MRVVYFVSLFPCWSETFIVREIHALIALGVDVRIVSLKHPTEELVQLDAQSLAHRVIYPVPWWTTLVRTLSRLVAHPHHETRDLFRIVTSLASHPEALAKSLVVWWRTLALLPEIRSLHPDHLHAHWATYPSTSAWLAASRLGVTFSFTAHAHDIFLEDHLLSEKMKTAAFGVTISDFNRSYLAETVSSKALDCIRVIHCGVSPASFAFQPQGRRPAMVVAVGRLDPIKGFGHLIDACALLAVRGVPFTCNIVGEGPERGDLQRRIELAGLSSQVRLLGAQPQAEVRRLLAEASLFVLPSVVTAEGDRDGIPVSLMEAMAVGLPVVSTRVSGIPELVIDGVTGQLAEPGDVSSLANAMARVLGDPQAVANCVVAARARVEAEFDVEKEARKLCDAMLGARHSAALTRPGLPRPVRETGR